MQLVLGAATAEETYEFGLQRTMPGTNRGCDILSLCWISSMVGSRCSDFESVGRVTGKDKDKEAIDDAYNCSWCSVGFQPGDGVQCGHHANAGWISVRSDDQGCGRLRPGILARSAWCLSPDGRPRSSLPSRLSHRTRRPPLLAQLIRPYGFERRPDLCPAVLLLRRRFSVSVGSKAACAARARQEKSRHGARPAAS